MAPKAGAGIKGHEAEWLRLRGIDHFPDVDVHPIENDFHLIDEGDVHGAENVFQEFGRFGHFRGRNGDDLINCRSIERCCGGK